MDLFVSIIIGLVSGVLSGIISSFLLRVHKPKIKISDKISRQLNGSNDKEYRIKIVNKSKYYVKNMHIFTELVTYKNAPDGIILTTQPIRIARSDISFIEPYNKKDDNALYAIRIRLYDDLEKLWADDSSTYFQIKVYCENELNSCGKIFSTIYRNKKCIQNGTFKTKKSMEII